MKANTKVHCELLVIGAGMAGMAAALFASNRHIDTLQVGITSEMIFASGLLDLLGIHPVEKGIPLQDPWHGLETLCQDHPEHPYAKMPANDIRAALDELVAVLDESGFGYKRYDDHNAMVVTPAGTIRPSYYIPKTMWNGVKARALRAPCLIVDIDGLKGFSARQYCAHIQSSWSDLKQTTISFPGSLPPGEVYLEPLARSLAIPQNLKALANVLAPLLDGVEYLGLPAVLGIQEPDNTQTELERLIGVSVFEIPTMPPSIPGLRLKETLESVLKDKGVQQLFQKRVLDVEKTGNEFVVHIGNTVPQLEARCQGIILASGRFLGKGLYADRMRIRESIFNLPVHQPEKRNEWHRHEFLDPAGHPINRSGLLTDDHFRPLDHTGRPAHEMLFTAGSILAHQDWMRQKCGSGLAIATAFAAVNAFIDIPKLR